MVQTQTASKYNTATCSPHILPEGWGRDSEKGKTHGLRQEQLNNSNKVKHYYYYYHHHYYYNNNSNRKEKETEKGIKPKKKQLMPNTVAHCLLTNAQPVPEQQSAPSRKLSQFVYWACCHMLWNISGLWVSCPGHASSWLLVQLLTGRVWETEKSFYLSTYDLPSTKISGCYQHYSHIQNTALFQLLRKLTLFQSKPR